MEKSVLIKSAINASVGVWVNFYPDKKNPDRLYATFTSEMQYFDKETKEYKKKDSGYRSEAAALVDAYKRAFAYADSITHPVKEFESKAANGSYQQVPITQTEETPTFDDDEIPF